MKPKMDTNTQKTIIPDPSPHAHKLPQILAATASSIGLFACGTINGWSATALTKLDEDFKMKATDYSLVVTVIYYGALIGSLLSGKAMDIFGRKRLMMLSTPLAIMGWIVIGSAPNLYLIYFGRLLTGMFTGFVLNTSNIYTSETCEAALRGRLGSLNSFNLTFGVLTTYVLGGICTWKISAYLCIVPLFIFLIALCQVPESPYWYLLKSNEAKATESLTRLRGPKYDAKHDIKAMTEKISDVGTNVSCLEMLHKRTLLPLGIAFFIQTIQQLTGSNIITMYTSKIFEEAGSSVDIHMATIYTGVAQLVGVFISMFLIDKYGRKVLLIGSVTCCGIFIALLGGYFFGLSSSTPWPKWMPLALMNGMVFAYGLGCRSIPWLIGTELFNTSFRSRANALIVFYNRAFGILVVQIYPYAEEAYGNRVVFITFGILCFFSIVGTLIFVPETKGKSLEEIQEYFERKELKSKEHKSKELKSSEPAKIIV